MRSGGWATTGEAATTGTGGVGGGGGRIGVLVTGVLSSGAVDGGADGGADAESLCDAVVAGVTGVAGVPGVRAPALG